MTDDATTFVRPAALSERVPYAYAAVTSADRVVHTATDRREDLDAVWDVVRGAFGDHDAPGTLLGVTVLGWPDQLVEVEAVAVLPASRPSRP